MLCYYVEVMHRKGDIGHADIWREEVIVFDHLYKAVDWLKDRGFKKMPEEMWPFASRPNLAWYGVIKEDYDRISAFVQVAKFVN